MSSAAPSDARADATVGMTFMVVAMLLVPGLDVIAKLLMERLPAAEVGFGRFFAQSLILLPIVLLAGRLTRPNRHHAAAGVCLGLALFAINLALDAMPVANAIAIFFVEPLILTVLAGILLKEGIGWRRLLAVVVGLAGALVVLRPNVAAYGPAAAWPLAAAVFFSFYMLVTRMMARRGSRLALQFWTGVFAMLTLALLAAGGWVLAPATAAPLVPTGRELLLFAGMGVIAALTHQLIANALAKVDAGAAAPLQYLEIISATLLGWLVFGDFPDRMTWAGTAIIVAAGIYVFHRERQLSMGPRVPPTPMT